MAFTNAHIYLRAGGHFGTSSSEQDEWSTGARFAIVGADVPYSESALQTFVDAAWTAFSALHSHTGTVAGNACFLDWTTAARVGMDGKYDPDTQDTKRHDGTALVGTATTFLPWNTAHVISLRTARPRGYASNGRMYYPATSIAITNTTGRITPSAVSGRVNQFKTLFDSLNVAAAVYATNMRLAVMSAVGAGQTALVNTIRADDRLDSIERREAELPSTWTTATLA